MTNNHENKLSQATKEGSGGRRREHSLENELGSAMVTDAVVPRLPTGVG